MKLQGKVYDGQISAGYPVEVSVNTAGLQIQYPAGGSRTLDWKQVPKGERVGSEHRIELPPEVPDRPAPVLMLPGNAFREATTGIPAARNLGLKKRSTLLWLVIVALSLPAVFFVVNWATPRMAFLISIEQEEALGLRLKEQMDMLLPSTRGSKLKQAALQKMVDRLAPADSPYTYEVTLIDDPMVNAFAAPGGQIIVFSGLMDIADTPEAVAGVMAHEIAHIEGRHGIKTLLKSAGVLVFTSAAIGGGFESLGLAETATELSSLLLYFRYSRELENEADRFASAALTAANIPLDGIEEFFHTLAGETPDVLEEKLSWLSTHPASSRRAHHFHKAAEGGATENPEWLEALRPVLFE